MEIHWANSSASAVKASRTGFSFLTLTERAVTIRNCKTHLSTYMNKNSAEMNKNHNSS